MLNNYCNIYLLLLTLGIEYLREYLHLPPEIVPATLKRQPKSDTARARPRASEPREGGGRDSDRDQYRRGGQMEGKPAGAGADFNPEFVSTTITRHFYCMLGLKVRELQLGLSATSSISCSIYNSKNCRDQLECRYLVFPVLRQLDEAFLHPVIKKSTP